MHLAGFVHHCAMIIGASEVHNLFSEKNEAENHINIQPVGISDWTGMMHICIHVCICMEWEVGKLMEHKTICTYEI